MRLPNPAIGRYVRHLELNLQVSTHMPDLRYMFQTVTHYEYRSYMRQSPVNLLHAYGEPSYSRRVQIARQGLQ
jgi:hypothetical protein